MKCVKDLNELGIIDKSRVLVIMPHPDDEAIFMGGFLRKAAKALITLKLVTVTAGEKSTLRYTLPPDADLGEVRKKELARALGVLGIHSHEVWNFSDGGVEKSRTELSKKIQREVASFYPTHTICLEPDGIYGHPDHIALSRCVADATKSPTRLLYVTVTPHYTFPTARRMAKKAVIQPITPDYKVALTTEESITKLRAVWAHRSQFASFTGIATGLIIFLANDMIAHEFFAEGN